MSLGDSVRGRVFFMAGIVVLVATMCLLPTTARAAAVTSVTVECDNPAAPYHRINAAVGDPGLGRPLEITVTGTCLERVVLADGGFAEESVYIHPPEGQRATITPGGNQGTGSVVLIGGAHGITLERLDISGGSQGVYIFDASEVDFFDVTIEGNTSAGVRVGGNSIAYFLWSRIRNNGVTGVNVTSQGGSTVYFQGGPDATVIEGNGQFGVNVGTLGVAWFAGPNIVRNNGGTTTAATHGGIHAARTSAVHIQADVNGNGTEITGNVGPGILAEVNSSVSLQGANINNNSEQGVRLRTQSVLELVGQDTFTTNGIANITCDAWSLLTGDTTGIKVIDCRNVDIPPRK